MTEPDRSRTKARMMRLTEDAVDGFDRPLRVMLVSVTGEMGGAERSLFEVASAIPRQHLDIQACCPPNSSLGRLFRTENIPVYEIPFRRFRRTANPWTLAGQIRALYKGATELSAVCRSQKIDLIHANTDSAAIVAWETARATHLPFIWHCRDIRPLHGLARVVSAASAAVVAISGAVEQHLRHEGVPTAKIRRIDNGVDISRFPDRSTTAEVRAAKRAELGLKVNQPMILSAGGMAPWKRHEKFLEIVAGVRGRIPDAIGVLAGGDLLAQNEEYEKSLRNNARRLGLLPGGVQLLGQRDDIPALMAAADVFVSCSENEPFGRVLVEAGAAGLPVVSTRSGGKAEIVEEGVTGLLAAQTDTFSLIDHCVRLLGSARDREAMGTMARMRIERLYDARRTAEQVGQLFLEVATPRKAPHV